MQFIGMPTFALNSCICIWKKSQHLSSEIKTFRQFKVESCIWTGIRRVLSYPTQILQERAVLTLLCVGVGSEKLNNRSLDCQQDGDTEWGWEENQSWILQNKSYARKIWHRRKRQNCCRQRRGAGVFDFSKVSLVDCSFIHPFMHAIVWGFTAVYFLLRVITE